MADNFDPIAKLSYFFAGDNKSLPASTRQKIALAMMMQKKAYPKTFGEGLAAIGDSIGDIGTMRRLESEAATGEAANKAKESEIIGGATPAAVRSPLPYSAEDDSVDPAAPRVIDPQPIVPATPPAAQTPTVMPPPQPPMTPPVTPATPLPADQQQSQAPGAPVRMLSPEMLKNWRLENPLPPGVPPPPGRQSAAQPPPGTPVMAFSGDASENVPPPANPRDVAAAALMSQQTAAAVPPANPTMPAGPGGPPPSALPLTDHGIKPAPPPQPPAPPAPPQQVAQAAPVTPQAQPGYVVDPGPAPPPPPTQTSLMQRIQQAVRDAPPSEREGLAERLKDYYATEQAKVTQAHEIWKEQMAQHRALTLKMHEQRAAARAAEDAAAAAELSRVEARQKIEKGNIPEVKQDIETGHWFNPQTRQWEVPPIAGTGPEARPAFKGTDAQNKALVNYGRAKIAHEGLQIMPADGTETGEQALASSPLQAGLTAIPFGAGRWARSDAYKEADTHAENFVQAFIRQQSGGAYTPTELESEARAMLPKVGDTALQLQDKREQRQQFLDSMSSVVGPGGQKTIAYDAARRERTRTAAPDPLEGREAVFPDKSIRVRRNGQWVPK